MSLVSDDEKDLLSAIEKLLKKRIDLKKAEGYEGEPPADIVADEKERDVARKRELEKLRESRRKQRKEKPAKTEVAKEVHEAVKLEAQAAGLSDNPDERFEKKIRRIPRQKATEVQQPQVTKSRRTRREPNPDVRGNNGQAAQNTQRTNERNVVSKARPARRGTPGNDRRSSRASWEPADPFAPEIRQFSCPKRCPATSVHTSATKLVRTTVAILRAIDSVRNVVAAMPRISSQQCSARRKRPIRTRDLSR